MIRPGDLITGFGVVGSTLWDWKLQRASGHIEEMTRCLVIAKLPFGNGGQRLLVLASSGGLGWILESIDLHVVNR